MFRRLGAFTISTDAIAHELLEPGTGAYEATLRRFGRAVLAPDGRIDRRALADLVFRSPAHRKALERILHPRIMAEVRRRSAGRRAVVVVDVPLLFEAGWEGGFDITLAVAAPRRACFERLKARGWTIAEARRRMRAQMPPGEKERRADCVLDNSEERERLARQVRRLYRALELIARSER